MVRPTARIPLPVMRRVGSKGKVSKKAIRHSTYPIAEIVANANQVQIPKRALMITNGTQKGTKGARHLYTAQAQLSQKIAAITPKKT